MKARDLLIQKYKFTDSVILSKLRRFCVIIQELLPLTKASPVTKEGLGEQINDYIDELSLDVGEYFDKFDPNMITDYGIGLPDKILKSLVKLIETNPEQVFEGLDKQDER